MQINNLSYQLRSTISAPYRHISGQQSRPATRWGHLKPNGCEWGSQSPDSSGGLHQRINADLFTSASDHNHARLLVNSHYPCWFLSQISVNRSQSLMHRPLRWQALQHNHQSSDPVHGQPRLQRRGVMLSQSTMGSCHLKSHSFIYSTNNYWAATYSVLQACAKVQEYSRIN